MNLRYLLGAITALPLLPLLYLQGRRIRARIPPLPEAKRTEGLAHSDTPHKPLLHLLTLGESTIAGVGVETHEEGFTGTFAYDLATRLDVNITWKVYGKSGYTAKQVTEKIIPKINEQQVDLIIIGLGGNDAFTLNNPRTWKKQVGELIASIRLKYPAVLIVFTNMPPIKEFPAFTSLMKYIVGNLGEILGDTLQDLVKNERGIIYFSERITIQDWIDRKLVQPLDPSDFFSDGVHPSALTYQTWAKAIAEKLSYNSSLEKWVRKRSTQHS
jgi:lysophospholipase L1-like esterase